MALAPLNRMLVCDREQFSLRLYERPLVGVKFAIAREYVISVGAPGYVTPRGLYLITRKARDPDWQMPASDWIAPEDWGRIIPGGDPRNPIKARWLEIYDGVGIHGTEDESSLGRAASHGCIRLSVPDVIELFGLVRRNTPIQII
jgi:lipoprotein-anchoring transpeptidase ErfK/SrfK